MSQPQKGICAEPNLHAQYLLFNVIDEDDQAIRAKLAHILNIFEHYDEEHYEAMVSGVIAIGTNYWMEIYPGLLPLELAPFPDMHHENRSAPVVPCDLFIQIRADRADIVFAIAREVFELLKPHVELLEQVKGFRYLDGRDLTGFVDGAQNPRGLRKLDVAIVGDQDPDFAGGSYIHVQRYRHNLAQWNLLPVARQEAIMGFTKEDNTPLPDDQLAGFSHRAHMLTDDGKHLDILRQSMPYGDMTEQGLFFVSCACSPKPFTQMLRNMIMGKQPGVQDRLLDFTKAETGAAFFAPSVSFIKRQSKQ